MHPVVVFDLITFLASGAGLVLLLTGWRRALQPKANLVIAGLLILIGFQIGDTALADGFVERLLLF